MAARGLFSFIHPDNLTPATLKDAVSKSHDERPATGHKFREISITLDLYRWKGGTGDEISRICHRGTGHTDE